MQVNPSLLSVIVIEPWPKQLREGKGLFGLYFSFMILHGENAGQKFTQELTQNFTQEVNPRAWRNTTY